MMWLNSDLTAIIRLFKIESDYRPSKVNSRTVMTFGASNIESAMKANMLIISLLKFSKPYINSIDLMISVHKLKNCYHKFAIKR